MMNTLTANLQNVLEWVQTNPLIVTLMSGGAVVWLFSNIRSIWHFIVNIITTFISFTIYNTYEDTRAEQRHGNDLTIRQMIFNRFLTTSKTVWERTINIDLSANAIDNYYCDGSGNESLDKFSNDKDVSFMGMTAKSITNTYGFSIKIIFGKICFVNRSYRQDGMKMIINTTIRVFFAWKKCFVKRLEDYIREKHIESVRYARLSDYVSIYNGIGMYGCKLKRKLDSIFTDGDVHKKLFNDIKKFLDNKETYNKLNYPYNYCALLYGVPGSGKSSTLLAIATELDRNIQYINLGEITFPKLLDAVNSNVNNTIFVFEDIDAISTKSNGRRKSSSVSDDYDRINNPDAEDDSLEISVDEFARGCLSLSDILNFTDGLLASDGAICLFTTNHIEKLDPAFIRAGRMNKMVEYKYMNAETANKMICSYIGHNISGLKDNIHPAELQEMILDILTGKCTEDDLKEKLCV